MGLLLLKYVTNSSICVTSNVTVMSLSESIVIRGITDSLLLVPSPAKACSHSLSWLKKTNSTINCSGSVASGFFTHSTVTYKVKWLNIFVNLVLSLNYTGWGNSLVTSLIPSICKRYASSLLNSIPLGHKWKPFLTNNAKNLAINSESYLFCDSSDFRSNLKLD